MTRYKWLTLLEETHTVIYIIRIVQMYDFMQYMTSIYVMNRGSRSLLRIASFCSTFLTLKWKINLFCFNLTADRDRKSKTWLGTRWWIQWLLQFWVVCTNILSIFLQSISWQDLVTAAGSGQKEEIKVNRCKVTLLAKIREQDEINWNQTWATSL